MKYWSRILTLSVGATAIFTSFDGAAAQQVTNSMTCERAISVYASQGRVTTRTRSGAVLPIYGGVPAYKGRSLVCGPDRVRSSVRVITTDNRRCVIAYRCS